MKRAAVIIATIGLVTTVLLGAWVHTAGAYTYLYHNKTDQAVRIDVVLYDDVRREAEIAPHQSHMISTGALIRSWSVDVYSDNKWQQALELTCDLLPGDHTFSIYVKEIGAGTRDWYVIKE